MTTAVLAQVTEPRARFRDLVAAEWIKLWSLRSTPWTFLISALLVMAFNVGAAYDHHHYWSEYDERGRADFIRSGMPLLDAFTTNAAPVLVLCLGAIGGMAIVGEYSTGQIRTTFAAVPARRAVMAAKVGVVSAAATLFGTVVAAGSFAVTQAILSGRDAGVSIAHPGALRVVVASALLAPVSALVGLALGTVLRHVGTTMVITFAVLVVLPVVVNDDRHWTAVIAHVLPFNAWERLVRVQDTPDVAFPWTLTGAWTVYAVWAIVSAAVAVTSVQRRDQ